MTQLAQCEERRRGDGQCRPLRTHVVVYLANVPTPIHVKGIDLQIEYPSKDHLVIRDLGNNEWPLFTSDSFVAISMPVEGEVWTSDKEELTHEPK